MDYQETISYLYGLERFGMVFGLENITHLAQTLGNPHQDLKVIHVGGTNGKGSVCAMIASILHEEGHRVGLYTSPHLISFTERIQIDGVEISWNDVIRLTDLLRSRVEEEKIPQRFTFFDFTTALAFYYFSLQEVDISIIEVGLGGRLDSTNIVEPLITVITTIDMDHYQILGERIDDIAKEKVGIVKAGIPLISGVTQPSVITILEEECRIKASPLRLVGKDFTSNRIAPGTFNFHGHQWRFNEIQLGVAGLYQIDNATVALGAMETLEEMGYRIQEKSIYEGLQKVRWPGRFDLVRVSSPRILLDGAHNPAAAQYLRDALQEEFDYNHLFMILGIMEDKDIAAIVAELAPLADLLVASRPHTPRAVSPYEIADIAQAYCKDIQVIEDIGKGIVYLQGIAQDHDLILITGSLYTVGEARAHLLQTSSK